MNSLEELCLNLIRQEFERFHFAFTVSKEETLKNLFEFLRRKYSFRLLSMLGKLKDEYIDFLVNEHLKELNWYWFGESHLRNSMKDIFCRLPNLKILCFPLICNDGHLESIAKFCPKIVEINISSSAVTDDGIKHLCKGQTSIVPCPQLKKLVIGEWCFITDESVKCLIFDSPSLEIIDYPNTPKLLYDIHEKDLPELENIRSYELTELNLLRFVSLPFYADLLKVCLNVSPKLKSMACCITDKEQLDFFNNTSLVDLHLQFTISPRVNMDNFLKNNGNNLVSLKLDRCLLSISDLIVCSKLNYLYVSNVSFYDDDSHQGITSLVEFTLQNTPMKEVVFLLLSSPNLKSISINSCVLFNEVKMHILRLVENRSVGKLTFESCWGVEMSFVRDILLNGSSSMELFLIDCDYNTREITELQKFAASLDHKPRLHITELSDYFSSSDSDDEIGLFSNYNTGYFNPHDLYSNDIQEMLDDSIWPSSD